MRRSTVDRLLPLVPALVLALVATVQIWRVHTLDQSSWTGAGFGMFARVDNEDSRFVRIQVESTAGVHPVPLPDDVTGDDLTAVPDEDALSALAQQILDESAASADPAVRVTAQLWGVEWARDSSTVQAVLLAERTREANSP